jgi:hypothetical protein
MPRKYTKKSSYWNKFSSGNESENVSLESLVQQNPSEPQLVGDPFYNFDSKANYSRNGGVAIFRNAVDIMSEFSNAEINLEGGSAKARDFFSKWMRYIKIWKVKDQYFREYYRSEISFFTN